MGIQIQLLLKLNLILSNCTPVGMHSNTTLVKVKSGAGALPPKGTSNSNTTLVKVKC